MLGVVAECWGRQGEGINHVSPWAVKLGTIYKWTKIYEKAHEAGLWIMLTVSAYSASILNDCQKYPTESAEEASGYVTQSCCKDWGLMGGSGWGKKACKINHITANEIILKTSFWPMYIRSKIENQNIKWFIPFPTEFLTSTKIPMENERITMWGSTCYQSCNHLQALFQIWAWPPPAVPPPGDSLAPSPGHGFLTWCWSCWA